MRYYFHFALLLSASFIWNQGNRFKQGCTEKKSCTEAYQSIKFIFCTLLSFSCLVQCFFLPPSSLHLSSPCSFHSLPLLPFPFFFFVPLAANPKVTSPLRALFTWTAPLFLTFTYLGDRRRNKFGHSGLRGWPLCKSFAGTEELNVTLSPHVKNTMGLKNLPQISAEWNQRLLFGILHRAIIHPELKQVHSLHLAEMCEKLSSLRQIHT